MRLNNRYFAMRHGQSLANEQGLIISDPASGLLAEYGLSETGKKQVRAAAERADLPRTTLIFSSDFSRVQQTAEITREVFDADTIKLTPLLRERYFGNWEKTSNTNYEKIWQLDKQSADTHKDILLVSHGDTLQILQTGLAKMSLTKHRELPHLETAEIRQLA
jgi:probable phosphoglycerate mutase